MMEKKKPGMFDALRASARLMAESLREPLNQLMDAFYGVSVRRSEHVRRGEVLHLEPNAIHGRTIMMHPLDAIAAEFPRDFMTQSLEVGIYFAERACVQLDDVNVSLQGMCNNYADLQGRRMAAWMVANDVDAAMLAAAKYRKLINKYGLEQLGDLEVNARFMREHPAQMRIVESL